LVKDRYGKDRDAERKIAQQGKLEQPQANIIVLRRGAKSSQAKRRRVRNRSYKARRILGRGHIAARFVDRSFSRVVSQFEFCRGDGLKMSCAGSGNKRFYLVLVTAREQKSSSDCFLVKQVMLFVYRSDALNAAHAALKKGN